jgi:hypothetical protein
MKELFNENYYNSLNYISYLCKEDKYVKLAKELHINQIIDKTKSVIDYGAAVGFLTNALLQLGYNCDGYDISQWATSESKRRYGINFITEPKKYDYLISLDVFEHMMDNDISNCLNNFNPDHIIVRIPVCISEGKPFHLNVSNLDKTHINCKTKLQWINFFKHNGYSNASSLNLFSIYDSKGVMCYKLYK